MFFSLWFLFLEHVHLFSLPFSFALAATAATHLKCETAQSDLLRYCIKAKAMHYYRPAQKSEQLNCTAGCEWSARCVQSARWKMKICQSKRNASEIEMQRSKWKTNKKNYTHMRKIRSNVSYNRRLCVGCAWSRNKMEIKHIKHVICLMQRAKEKANRVDALKIGNRLCCVYVHCAISFIFALRFAFARFGWLRAEARARCERARATSQHRQEAMPK